MGSVKENSLGEEGGLILFDLPHRAVVDESSQEHRLEFLEKKQAQN